jgi:heme exporter protein A
MNSGETARITTENLSRSFGNRRAVHDVSFALNPGDALALFGPNGAGKTTLLRMLGGLLKPTSGAAEIGGVRLPGGAEVRRQVGVISHHTLLYDALTARENVEFAARLYHVDEVKQRTERALDAMAILERADTPVRSLSRGMKQRVSIARAMVHEPKVILADEPFTGLDVVGAKALSSLLKTVSDGGATIVLVTHNISEGLEIATRAAIMNRGSFVRVEERARIDERSFASEYQQVVMESA